MPAGDLGSGKGRSATSRNQVSPTAHDAVTERRPVTIDIDLPYGDHEGGQHPISRFVLIPEDDGGWTASSSRHWNLDRADPR